MNMNDKSIEFSDAQSNRDEFISRIDVAEDKTKFILNNASSLFALDLTMYSRNYSFDSLIYSAFATSELDENISLHPEQLRVIELFNKSKGVIFSAPTSFGKTFVVFEYIARFHPKNIVLIVPTLALIDEYKKKIIKSYKNCFNDYKLYLSIDENKNYNFGQNNIFILTHDKVVNESTCNILEEIDLLVVDEVYKLQKDEKDDRVLILNIAYYNLVQRCKKYILLAPFISGVDNLNQLGEVPKFVNTNFSPVVNTVKTYEIIDESERILYTNKILSKIKNTENTLVYFPTVVGINNFINNLETINESQINNINSNRILREFVEWAKTEIHEEWSVIKALEHGFLVHHGQLPLGIRLLQLDLFNGEDNRYSRLLCTSTLLEGVNTTAKHIIITKPSRSHNSGNFDAFDFYNLVGRTGRLYKHYLGIAHYIKAPSDPIYLKSQALKTIQFELTENTIDIDINCNDYRKHPEFVAFLDELGITYEDYKREIYVKCRFGTVLFLHTNYLKHKDKLINELYNLSVNDAKGKLDLIRCLYEIIEGKNNKLNTFIINKLTYLTRPSVRQVVEETKVWYSKLSIDDLISTTIRNKSSYIEFNFYNKISIIKFFLECDKIPSIFISTLHSKLTRNIELLYYMNSPARKMLKDMGIYESDIEKIINIIGDEFETVSELQAILKNNFSKLTKAKIGIVSTYVIQNLIS